MYAIQGVVPASEDTDTIRENLRLWDTYSDESGDLYLTATQESREMAQSIATEMDTLPFVAETRVVPVEELERDA